MDSRNPIFSDKLTGSIEGVMEAPMTVQGALNKTLILVALMLVSATVVWQQAILGYADKVNMLMMGGLIIGFILALVICFNQKMAPLLSPVYAFAEGAALGGLSAMLEARYPGIAIQAAALTFLAIFSMALLYKTGVIKCTDRFRSTIITATFAIMIFYLIGFIASLFHFSMPLIYGSGLLSIGLSIFVVGLASLNLIIDFDFIEQGANRFLPKSYEWYGAFGLLVTIVWMYIEILRLLSKLRER